MFLDGTPDRHARRFERRDVVHPDRGRGHKRPQVIEGNLPRCGRLEQPVCLYSTSTPTITSKVSGFAHFYAAREAVKGRSGAPHLVVVAQSARVHKQKKESEKLAKLTGKTPPASGTSCPRSRPARA